MHKQYIWKTARIVQETIDTITMEFNTGTDTFEYKAGQFINLTILVNGTPVTRSYSLSSAPGVDDQPAITIKRVPGGLMSNFLFDHAQSVVHWEIDGPYGAFVYPGNTQHIVLMAAGSGISPCFSIAKWIIRNAPSINLILIYANKSREDIIFNDAIRQWAAEHKGRFTVIHALSQQLEQVQRNADEIVVDRLNEPLIKELITKHVLIQPSEAQYLICGPSSLIKIKESSLAALAVPADHIIVERYKPDENASTAALPARMYEVMLHYYEQSNLLEVQPGSSILTTALEDRIPLPFSCKNGTCGKCAARVTAGEVTMAANYVLGQEELDAGIILLCQSYPLTEDVTIEIGG